MDQVRLRLPGRLQLIYTIGLSAVRLARQSCESVPGFWQNGGKEVGSVSTTPRCWVNLMATRRGPGFRLMGDIRFTNYIPGFASVGYVEDSKHPVMKE